MGELLILLAWVLAIALIGYLIWSRPGKKPPPPKRKPKPKR